MTSGWNARIAALLCTWAAAATLGAAEGVVRDAVTGAPIEATIVVQRGPAPADFLWPHGPRVATARDGRFVAAGEGWVSLFVRADGYEDRWVTLVPLASAEPIEIELTPRLLDDTARSLLETKHEARKEQAYLEMPPEPLAHDAAVLGEVAFASAYAVPSEVWVSNLAGYTGMFDFDAYIAGVVAAEMGDGFPFEALKAQAIAARSYALERFLRTGTANGGQAFNASPGPKAIAATKNTTRMVMLHAGAVIQAFYSARCNGDFTLPSELGLSNITTCIVTGLCGGCVRPYTRKRACSGHVNCSSTTERCCDVVADGRRQWIYGHGVGLCQRGAQRFAGVMAHDWESVLHAYYSDITIANGPGLAIGSAVRATTNALNLRASPCGSSIATVNAGATGIVLEGPQRPPCSLTSGTSYVTWWRVQFGEQAAWVAEDFLELTATALPAPAVQTLAASSISPAGATLSGAVKPNGNGVTIGFEYGRTIEYGSSVVAGTASGSEEVGFRADVTGLACATTYHFRAFAETSGSRVYGGDQTFSTGACRRWRRRPSS